MNAKRIRQVLALFVVGLCVGSCASEKLAAARNVLLVLAVVVTVHEFGHLCLALANGVKVYRYSIFMGPALHSKRMFGIDFQIGTIPVGGYVQCKMEPEDETGPIGDSVDEKKWWQQFLFFGGGIAWNIVSGYLALVVLLMATGTPVFSEAAKINMVVAGSPADTAGIQPGDVLVAANSAPVSNWKEFLDIRSTLEGDVSLTIMRGQIYQTLAVRLPKGKLLGMSCAPNAYEPCPFKTAHSKASGAFVANVEHMARLLTGREDLAQSLQGPVGIVSSGMSFNSAGIPGLVMLFSLLSYGIAIANLLPLPALDGGHLVCALLKAVRLEPSIEARKVAIITGVIALLLLTVILTVKDIWFLVG